MTTEEKAKAYDEALKDMRVIYPNLKGDAKLAVEHAFPELVKSEDERIRKVIRVILIATEDEQKDFYSTHGLTRKDCTDWLEKQKEVGIRWFESDNIKNPDKPYIDKVGMFYTTDGRMCHASDIEKQKDILSERATNITANMLEDGIEGIQRELIEFLSNTINAPWVDIIKSADAYAQRIKSMIEKQKERGPLTKEEEYTLHRIIEYLEDEICPSEWVNLLHDIYCLPYQKQKEPHYTKRNALFDKCVENCDPEVMKSISDEVDKMLEKEQKPVKCELEDAFKYYTDAGITISCEDIVAKQKDQKPEPVFKVGDKIKLKSELNYPYREIIDIKNGAYYFDEAVYLPFDNQDNWEKEQKPSHKFNVGDTIHCKYDDREFTIKSVDLANGVYEYTKEGCGNDIDYADENFELVEQKPVKCIDFYDEFYKRYTGPRDILAYVNMFVKKLGYVPIDIDELSACVYYVIKHKEEDTKAKQKEQKPLTIESAYEKFVNPETLKEARTNKYIRAQLLWELMHNGIITEVDYQYLTDDKRKPWTAEEYRIAYQKGFDMSEQLKQKEQKSAEWSAKGRRGRIGSTPEHIRKKAENFLSKMEPPYDADDICSAYETGAMESIKQEWSEEDEKIRQKLIRFISSPNMEGFMLASDEQMFVSWLKSLRPMPKVAVADGTLWKPSEEQTAALNSLLCQGDFSYIGQAQTLQSLYIDLMKL